MDAQGVECQCWAKGVGLENSNLVFYMREELCKSEFHRILLASNAHASETVGARERTSSAKFQNTSSRMLSCKEPVPSKSGYRREGTSDQSSSHHPLIRNKYDQHRDQPSDQSISRTTPNIYPTTLPFVCSLCSCHLRAHKNSGVRFIFT